MSVTEENVVRCAATGKIRWSTKAQALAEIASITKRAMEGKTRPKNESGTYVCDHCNGWHLTSRPKTGELVPAPRRGRGKIRRRPRPRTIPAEATTEEPPSERSRA